MVWSCATRDDINKDNVCTPIIPSGIIRPPPSRPSRIYPECRAYETHVFTREGDAGAQRHIQRRGSGPSVQPDERVCIPRGKRQPQRRPVHRGRPAHTQRMVQLPEVHPRTVQPTERSPRAQNPDAKSRGTRDNAVRLRQVEPARVPQRYAAPSPPQVLDSLHRLAKAQSRRPPDFLSRHACQYGK